ncbi:MAG: hypothetical protein ACRD16_13240 [Thermoanaerobaculia bacterium]
MRPTKKFLNLALGLGAALLPFASGCTNKQGETESPVFITVQIPDNPGFVNIATPAPVQFPTITLQSHLKSPTATDPQHFQDVNITSYVVTYSRVDGGTKVPAPESFGGAQGLLPSGGTQTLSNFPGMYAYALQQSPFDQLLPFNGGIDLETGRTEIDMRFTFVFYGETVAGTRVASEPASAPLIFVYQP